LASKGFLGHRELVSLNPLIYSGFPRSTTMTTRPSFVSEEELIKRLQIVIRDVNHQGSAAALVDANIHEAQNLVSELASRIYGEPDKWGLAQIPGKFRDDVAQDALIMVLDGLLEYRGTGSVAEWFGALVDSRFREIWAMSEREPSSTSEDSDVPDQGISRTGPPIGEINTPSDILESEDGPWKKFEQEFPRDAFTLHLRYVMERSLEDMDAMLDAGSVRSIIMRLNRARDRFRMFCEQSGFDHRDILRMMDQFTEEGGR
jgi:hypothetical protein